MLEQFLRQNDISAVFNESMKKHTTFKVGGNAACVAMPDSVEKRRALINADNFLIFLRRADKKRRVL